MRWLRVSGVAWFNTWNLSSSIPVSPASVDLGFAHPFLLPLLSQQLKWGGTNLHNRSTKRSRGSNSADVSSFKGLLGRLRKTEISCCLLSLLPELNPGFHKHHKLWLRMDQLFEGMTIVFISFPDCTIATAVLWSILRWSWSSLRPKRPAK